MEKYQGKEKRARERKVCKEKKRVQEKGKKGNEKERLKGEGKSER